MPFVVNLSYRDLHREEIKECIEEVSPVFTDGSGATTIRHIAGFKASCAIPQTFYVGGCQ